MKIIFDYNRTIFNPENDALYPGAFDLLKKLSGIHELFLISTHEAGRKDRFNELGIEKFFKSVVFTNQKTEEVFNSFGSHTEKTFVVGDSIRNEISIGNVLGFITICVLKGKFADEIAISKEERPNHTIKELVEIEEILANYEK